MTPVRFRSRGIRSKKAAHDILVDGCLNPPEFGDMGSAAVAGSD